jgi:hypothetical protein
MRSEKRREAGGNRGADRPIPNVLGSEAKQIDNLTPELAWLRAATIAEDT